MPGMLTRRCVPAYARKRQADDKKLTALHVALLALRNYLSLWFFNAPSLTFHGRKLVAAR